VSAGERTPAAAPRLADLAYPAAALVAALAWWAVLVAAPEPAAWLPVKPAAVALLAGWAIAQRGRVDGAPLLAAALLAHAAGDLLLELAFLGGMAAFFAGHLLYIALFWRRRIAIDDVGGSLKLALGLLALLAAAVLLVLAPRLRGALAAAVPIYAGALAAMTGAAWLCRRGRPGVPVGAALFLASDALLAFELFGEGLPGGRLAVWPLYFAGQALIAWGWLRDEGGRHRGSGAGPGIDLDDRSV